ncbi:MAG TPA: protein kinase [Pyrinomonadaceae bacterium]|nr:protein kinase [Pyrinomonadaceae bacterium]
MIGQIFGNYKIEQKLGEGGMGAVYRGLDMMIEREVAIKFLRPELASQPQVVERFRSEAVTLAKLNHPNIATLYSFMRQGESYVMVLEFVRGVTLDHVIQERGAITHDRAVPIFCQVLDGIQHAHEFGVVHRDIKPANMMLTEKGTLKVLDFGIARILGTARMTRQGNVIGTIEYMSPEQVKGMETDARADIYSLGMLLYEMLTGRVPFDIQNEFELMRAQIEQYPVPPRQLNPAIPEVVEQAIWRAIAKEPSQRFQSAEDFRNFLLAAGYAATGRLDPLSRGDLSPYATRPLAQPPQSNPGGFATIPSQPGIQTPSQPGIEAPPHGSTQPSQPGFQTSAHTGPTSQPGLAPQHASGTTEAFDPLAATIITPPPASPQSGGAKETRIGPAPSAPVAPGQPPAAGAQAATPGSPSALKETRIGPAPVGGVAGPGVPPQGYGHVPPHQQPQSHPQQSFFSRLTWVHYAAAAAVGVVLLFGVLAAAGALVFLSGDRQAETKPNALTEQPVKPAQEAAPQPAPPVAPPAAPDQGVVGTEIPADAGQTPTPPAAAAKPDLTVGQPATPDQPSAQQPRTGSGSTASARPAQPAQQRPAAPRPRNNDDASERRRRSLEALDQ